MMVTPSELSAKTTGAGGGTPTRRCIHGLGAPRPTSDRSRTRKPYSAPFTRLAIVVRCRSRFRWNLEGENLCFHEGSGAAPHTLPCVLCRCGGHGTPAPS